jgi:3-oxoadipate enol-lactonase
VQIDHDGLSFNCQMDGVEGAPWLVFSNSLLTNLSLWDAQVAAFAGRFRILRYDQRGHGATPVPPHVSSLDELIGDAAALLDALAVRDATFVGVSLGAATALGVAARRPDLVDRVIACDGQCRTAPGGAEAWQGRVDFARQNGMAAVATATAARWFLPGFLSSPQGDAARAMVANTPLGGFEACANALQTYDLTEDLPHIAQKTLLVLGAEDAAMRPGMTVIRGLLPHAEFVEIPEAGHLPNFEQPVAFNAALEDFLRNAQATA